MKSPRIFLACCAIAGFAACTDRPESDFGSATDIDSNSGTILPTNNLNAADVGLGGPIMREVDNFQEQPLPGQYSDKELEKQIKVALTTGSMGTTGVIAENQLTTIAVQVQGGVVTLSGPVSSELEHKTIEKQVAGMKGVKSVRNMLTIRPGEHVPLDPLVPRTPGTETK